ncbi:MAG: putative multidrug resistance ABC transporter ATP-binding/permease protein YheI [candidate division BRC1 bacterium ADurb.BinA292]|nr:MAG: putative multidrug resistance ABC transporter ATP-binding/permease protein YheI [candidate division BRC1 bacterium ADurb.BinA292]
MFRRFDRLKPYLWRHRNPLLLGMACLVASNYLDIRIAVMLGAGIDAVGLPAGPFGAVKAELLTIFLLVTLVLGIGAGVTRFYMRRLIINTSRNVEYEFRNDLFGHLLRLPASFYDRFRTGDVMARATSDIEAIRMVLGPAIMYVANSLVLFPMAVWQMAVISMRLMLLCFVPMLLVIPVVYYFRSRINIRARLVQEANSDLSANVQENLSGMRVIKVYAREQTQAEAFDRLSQRYVKANMDLVRLQAVFFPALSLMIGGVVAMLLLGGGVMIIRGTLTLGAIITFFALLMTCIWPLAAFGWIMAQLERGAASMKRVNEIFEAAPEASDEPEAAAEDLAAGAPAIAPVMRGEVGCGKSTLAHLLMRRYDPPRGALFIDGRDILDWPIAALRRQIGIVDQEPFLFSDTIAANVAFGVAEQEAERLAPRIERVTRVAQLDDEVRGFPQGYETILGERGINLSGGQRQRSALARALARDPALLILDDALAAVDTHTEEAILRGLRELLGQRTTLIISHRISTVSLADRIVYLEAGRVAEQGTHEELLARRGKYWMLAQRQRLAEEIGRTA